MKKKHLVSVLAVAVILVAGSAFLLNPAADLLGGFLQLYDLSYFPLLFPQHL